MNNYYIDFFSRYSLLAQTQQHMGKNTVLTDESKNFLHYEQLHNADYYECWFKSYSFNIVKGLRIQDFLLCAIYLKHIGKYTSQS